MNSIKDKLKSNKAFTFQDLTIGIMAILLFTGIIASLFVSTYKVKAETQVDSIATIYAVQILEYIDKIAYTEINVENINELKAVVREKFKIPNKYNINLEITPLYDDDVLKTVKLTLDYTYNNEDHNITIKRLKVKEA